MKRLKYRFKRFTATVLMSLTLFTTTANCYVQAAAIPILWGLAEIAGTLLFSAGVTYLGYQSIKNLTKDSDAYLDITARLEADEDIAAMLEEIDSVDGTGALDNLGEGESYSGTNFTVISGGNNTGIPSGKLNLSVNAGIIAKAAEIIQEFVESDANQYEVEIDVPYSYNSNKEIASKDSLSYIADMYDSAILEALEAKGYTDDNCCVLAFKDIPDDSSRSVIYFIPIPFDYTYIGTFERSLSSYYSNDCLAFNLIATSDFYKLVGAGYSSSELFDYVKNRRIATDVVVYDFIVGSVYESFEAFAEAVDNENMYLFNYYDDYSGSGYFCDANNESQYLCVFNFDNANNTDLISRANGSYFNNDATYIYTMFPASVSHYLSDSVASAVELPAEGVSITFDSSTSATFEELPDLAEVLEIAISLSPELTAIKELLESGQANDDANTDKVVDAIEAQTQGILGGLGDVIVEALERVFGKSETDADTDVDADAGVESTPPDGSGGDGSSSDSGGHVNILNGLLMLIGIFFILLRIFVHCLQFIINIFQIPADPGFLSGDVLVGFEYVKSVELGTWGITIYDFLLGLIHISLLFAVIGVLKKHIDKIKI